MIPIMNPKDLATRGENIYRDKYQDAFEVEHDGKFVAIDVYTEDFYLGDTPDEALRHAREANPGGLFHLIRVGSPGAYRVSYSQDVHNEWFCR